MDLPLNAKLREMQQNTHGLVQGPVHIPSWKGATPYSQLGRSQSISPTGKGQKAWMRALYQKWPKKMPGALTLRPLDVLRSKRAPPPRQHE